MKRMGQQWLVVLVLLASLLIVGGGVAVAQTPVGNEASAQAAMGTTVSYVGQLRGSSGAITGVTAFEFSLWNAQTGGTRVAGPITMASVYVLNGWYKVSLQFGSGAFNGEARWLGIRYRYPATSGTWASIAGRELLSASPYALYAQAVATHTHSGANITSGTVADARIASTIARDSEIVPKVSAAGFITKAVADERYVDVAGDVMTGTLTVPELKVNGQTRVMANADGRGYAVGIENSGDDGVGLAAKGKFLGVFGWNPNATRVDSVVGVLSSSGVVGVAPGENPGVTALSATSSSPEGGPFLADGGVALRVIGRAEVSGVGTIVTDTDDRGYALRAANTGNGPGHPGIVGQGWIGVIGQNTSASPDGNGAGVEGIAPGENPGVRAVSGTAGQGGPPTLDNGLALQVIGRAQFQSGAAPMFQTAGVLEVAEGEDSVTSGFDVVPDAVVLVTLQSDPGNGIAVKYVEVPTSGAGPFVVHMTGEVSSATKVGYFVLRPYSPGP